MSDRVDLTDIPVVDNHCHPVLARQDADPATWRGHFTESPDPDFRAADAVHTVFYRRLVKAMAASVLGSGARSTTVSNSFRRPAWSAAV